MDAQIQKAVEYIRESKGIMVLTGAGISTESGIPDFRSPGTGLWEQIDPMEALSTKVLFNHPEKFYRQGFKILTAMKDAVPNIAHIILAKMEEEGIIDLIVTQNIDNLHQKAGSKKVYEVHGHVRSGSCLNCKEEMPIDRMAQKVEDKEIPPRCNNCGGIVRPNVVMFGDSLPPCFDMAMDAVGKHDLLIVIGSSLEVGPVNYLAYLCKKLMIINLGSTAYDYRGDLIIHQKAGETLMKIYETLKKE
ncbi:SIR2 family NAD-dependent protein deacylase [Geosporobacter ferrireducens]|uniref:protein acetyllysine N-acetyltransferase n=1 Tax=Geosporobacter ferrireducens TaxID=1424294 RepID=A0A1D8GD41_9FIRM|nr:Sir2 family NAD-dependent protein deacetylase [Geosporobacter ferrireducens]AOT68821.1 NAD-dependent deacetylase [Geosporobacter ferrireducens]MTI56485.1 NAD-dependent deacetylase [Geosporobacter ferrireducens]